MDTITPPKFLYRIEAAADLLSIGRSKLYELIAAGEVRTVKIGRATRVPLDSIEAYVDRLRIASGFGLPIADASMDRAWAVCNEYVNETSMVAASLEAATAAVRALYNPNEEGGPFTFELLEGIHRAYGPNQHEKIRREYRSSNGKWTLVVRKKDGSVGTLWFFSEHEVVRDPPGAASK